VDGKIRVEPQLGTVTVVPGNNTGLILRRKSGRIPVEFLVAIPLQHWAHTFIILMSLGSVLHQCIIHVINYLVHLVSNRVRLYLVLIQVKLVAKARITIRS